MKKIWIGVVAGLFSAVAGAQDPSLPKPRPEISLTLVPPSPVTDQISLDVRGAVWNRGAEVKVFDVAVYLDEEKTEKRLHQETLTVAAQSAAGIKFRWPTKNQAGDHKILMVARAGSETRRMERPMRILASKIRSTDRIDGAWAGIYHWSESEGRMWNAEIKKVTDAQWGEMARGMHGIGMDIIVVQEMFRNQMYVGKHNIEKDGYKGLAFYPSKLYPGRMPIAAKDPLEAILSEADRLGMNVFVGVALYAWFDFTPGSLEWHKKVADELWDRYGHHPSFYGWYVGEEICGSLGADDRRRDEIVNFFREFTAHVRTLAPDKVVMLATNCHGVRQSGDYYSKLLPHLDILCPFGFHRMPRGDLTGEEAAALLQQYCDQAGMHFWMDMEVFLFGPGSALVPRSIGGLVSDLRRFPNFEKILCYQYPGLMTAPDASIKPGGAATVKLYQDYKNFLEGGLGKNVLHAAVGKPVVCATQCAPQYSGGGAGALTDGRRATDNYQDGLWIGYEGVGLDAVIDLGESTALRLLSTAFLQDARGGIRLPPTVEYAVSDDKTEFRVVATVKPVVSDPGAIAIGMAEAPLKGVRARYVRVRAANRGAASWLFVDELVVNPGKTRK